MLNLSSKGRNFKVTGKTSDIGLKNGSTNTIKPITANTVRMFLFLNAMVKIMRNQLVEAAPK